MALISIVIPAFNEEDNIVELGQQLRAAFQQIPQHSFEVIIVDNGSSDSTWLKIQEERKRDTRFKGLQLSRNFTAPGGITAGMKFAQGDALVVMCADLQDDPTFLKDLVREWEQGWDVAYQVVTERRGIGPFYRMASEVFHWLMNWLTSNAFPRNGSVYRIMSRPAYKAFNDLPETNRYFTGLCNWIGFRSKGLPFPRRERFAGSAKSSFRVVLKLAFNGIFGFSYVPLRLVSSFGFIISLASLVFILYVLGAVFVYGVKVPGLATQLSVMTFFFGALFLSIGILGEYLARIFDEVKGRPNFIVRTQVGLDQPRQLQGVYRNGAIVLGANDYGFKENQSVSVTIDA